MDKRTAFVTIEIESAIGPRAAVAAVGDALSRVAGCNGSVKMSVREVRMAGNDLGIKVLGRCENCGSLLLDLDYGPGDSLDKCADCVDLPSPPF